MKPLYIATERFDPGRGERWKKYIAWSGLIQLKEVVSLDGILNPSILKEIKPEYWTHIVNEDYMLHLFIDFDFLLAQVSDLKNMNLLCVFRNPPSHPKLPAGQEKFHYLGYDVVDVQGSISAILNCGGFPKAFANAELSDCGLLPSLERAMEVQRTLHEQYPNDRHADCNVWALFRWE